MKAITQQLKRFADDERAVSPVVGFVLIFALIMIVFTIYQAEVVPAQNAEVEFKHSQIVEGEISQLNDAIQQTGANGVPQSATIATGVQYPNRALAINPGAPAGTLKTIDVPGATDVEISGLSDGSGYWSGGQTFETHLISYQSNYNILQQETEYILENGMMVLNFENGNTLLKSNGSVIMNEGRRINLVLVGGDYQKSALTTSVTVQPVSTSTEYLQLESDGSGKISLPTTLPESEWRQMLDGDPSDPNDGKEYASFGGYTLGNPSTVTINLGSTTETYKLRISKVTLGSPDPPELKYLESEDPTTNPTVDAGAPITLTVSAHDEFGNPVVGAEVTATTNGAGTLTSASGTKTDDSGQAMFTYTPTSDDAGSTVTVDIELMGETGTIVDTITYTLNIAADSSDEDSGGIDNGYPIGVILETVSTPDKYTVELGFKNENDEAVTATRVRMNGILRNGANEVIPEITIEGTQVDINGGLTPLTNTDPIPKDGGTETMTITSADQFNKGGFLIIYLEFTTASGDVISDTYFVGVSSR